MRDAYFVRWGFLPKEDARASWTGAFFRQQLVGAISTIVFPEQREIDIMDLYVIPGRWGAIAAYELLNHLNDRIDGPMRVVGTVVGDNTAMGAALEKYGAKVVTKIYCKEFV